MSHGQMGFVLNEHVLLKAASKRSCFLCVVMINKDAALVRVIYQLHGVGDDVSLSLLLHQQILQIGMLRVQ